MTSQKTVGMLYSEGFVVLKKNYWKFVLISAIMLCAGIVADYLLQYAAVPVVILAEMLGFGISGALADGALRYRGGYYYGDYGDFGRGSVGLSILPMLFALFVLIAAFVLAICLIRMILIGTAEMGAKDAAVTMAGGGRPSFDVTLGKFGRRFWRFLGVNAWSALWCLLWGLLFVIPGVYKSYCYRMAPYLVLQYPDMTARQALRKSIEITQGHKGRLFGLDMIRLAFAVGAVLASCCLVFVPAVLAALFWLLPLGYALFAVAWLDIQRAAAAGGLLPTPDRPDEPSPTYASQTDGTVQAGFTELEEDSPEL